MTFNLIDDRWIPVRRLDGTRQIIAPWQVTDNLDSNPIISLDASRPDFNGALIQFLIGLVQTTMAPKRDKEWRNGLTKPPGTDELKTAFAGVSHAFNLDGDRPRFMQDLELEEGDGAYIQIDKLLMEMPGENTIKNNTDHFLKRDTVKRMCLPCSTMALFTLQTNAPSGGQGNRTSLRGGGPLTTIVMGDTLWQTIWFNILNEPDFLENYDNPSKVDDASIFPWMEPTRTSEKKGQETTPEHVHPAQMFWGMPRRIVMNFETDGVGNCDICGCNTSDLVTSYISKNYGTNYESWRHTLTPYSKNKNNEYIPRHGNPGGLTFRHWLGLVQNNTENGNEPAIVVHTFKKRQNGLESHNKLMLCAFGYDFDNMKARCWYEGKMPLIHVDENIREDYESVIERLIKTSEFVFKNTIINIKSAMFKRPGDVKGDFSFIDTHFWNDTESDFYQTLDKMREAMLNGKDTNGIKLQWLKILSRTGEQLFDNYSQSNQIEVTDPKRIVMARRNLHRFNSERNKKIIEILDLPVSDQ